MKVKRFEVIRPEVNVEFKKPILGRLYFLFIFPRLIKIKKVKMNVGGYMVKGSTFEELKFVEFKPITIFIIGIPRITFGAETG